MCVTTSEVSRGFIWCARIGLGQCLTVLGRRQSIRGGVGGLCRLCRRREGNAAAVHSFFAGNFEISRYRPVSLAISRRSIYVDRCQLNDDETGGYLSNDDECVYVNWRKSQGRLCFVVSRVSSE